MNSQNTEALPIKAQGGERLGPANCSASRTYWLYVWNESTQIPGRPANWSEQPIKNQANSQDEAFKWAESQAVGKIRWELYDQCAWNQDAKMIASKNRGLVTPNAKLCGLRD